MKISEMSLTVAADGSLLIPASIMQEMGLCTGSNVQVAYLTSDGIQNTFHEFLLSPGSIEESINDVSFQVPDMLLQQANMGENDDIKIICLNGCILICKDCGLDEKILADILDSLSDANDIAAVLSPDPQIAQNQLSEIMNELTERSDGIPWN